MKTKQILLLLLLTTNYLNAQIVNIPDPNFLHRLVNHTVFGGVQIDTNYNNQIEVSEAEAIVEMRVGDPFLNNYKIVDMTGIEAFVNLTKLECYNNDIEILDLSQNTLLVYLDCGYNNINSLNVSQCSALVELYSPENELYSLDVSQNDVLEKLICYCNSLAVINLEGATSLDMVGLNYNNLVLIDVSTNIALRELYAHHNTINSIDTSNNISLTTLVLGYNQLSEINVNHNINLEVLGINNNLISSIDVSQCVQLKKMGVGGNQLISLDISHNSFLQEIKINNNSLLTVDVRNNNNMIITKFKAKDNPHLFCIFVDDKSYSFENWIANGDPNFEFDTNSHFVETQLDCESIGIVEQHISNDLAIVPNPIDNTFIIDTKLNYHSIALYNNIGSLIAKYNKQDTYFLKELASGVYIVQIKTPKGVFTKKLIKQ